MLPRFRKEGRSESWKDLASDASLASEEVRRTADPGDADRSTASTPPEGPSADACPEVCEPEQTGYPALPAETLAPPSGPPANALSEAPAGVAGDVQGVPADLAVDEAAEVSVDEAASRVTGTRPRLMATRRGKGRSLAASQPAARSPQITPEQRLLLLDTWRRSGLPAKDFAALVGISKYTLCGWKKRFDDFGPAGLADQPRGGKQGSRLPEVAKRTILMLKEGHPQWGCQRISDMLARGPALPASASAVARVLHGAGYELVEEATRSHPDKVRRFERAKANQMWLM